MASDSKRQLKLSDNSCPICMYVFIEPVTMPCGHEMCLSCFRDNITETSLCCPWCRMRISTWARRAAKTNSLVNQKRWEEIKKAFPKKVLKRMEGAEDYSSGEDSDDQWGPVNIAEPGEIRKEYEKELQKVEEEKEKKKAEEEAASRELIEKLQKLDEEERLEKQRLALSDEILARELDEAIKESDKSLTSPELKEVIEQRVASRNSGASSKGKSTFLDRFLSRGATKIDRTGQTNKPENDSYPYRCISPWEKDTKEDASGNSSPKSRDSTLSYIYIDSNPPSRNKTTPNTPVADETGIGSQMEVPEAIRPVSKASSGDVAESLLVAMATEEDAGVDAKRSTSAMSYDSITQELNHFKPIRSCPKTPPRRLPSGQVLEAPLVRSTPRCQSGTAEIDTAPCNTKAVISSPIMKRQLDILAAERKHQVDAMSKSTDTGNVFGTIVGDHSYSSPSGLKTRFGDTPFGARSTVSIKELYRRSAVSTVTSSTAVQQHTTANPVNLLSRKLQFDSSNDDEVSKPFSPSPMPLLPLEPNLDEDDDPEIFFDIPQSDRFNGESTSELFNQSSCVNTTATLACTPGGTQTAVDDSSTGSKGYKVNIVKKSHCFDQKMKTRKISEHFNKFRKTEVNDDAKSPGISGISSICTKDLVGDTDRLKHDSGSPVQLKADSCLSQNDAVQSNKNTGKTNEKLCQVQSETKSANFSKRMKKDQNHSGVKMLHTKRTKKLVIESNVKKKECIENVSISANKDSIDKVAAWLRDNSDSDRGHSANEEPPEFLSDPDSTVNGSKSTVSSDRNNNTPRKVKRVRATITSPDKETLSPKSTISFKSKSSIIGSPVKRGTRTRLPKKYFSIENFEEDNIPGCSKISETVHSDTSARTKNSNQSSKVRVSKAKKATSKVTDFEVDSDVSGLSEISLRRRNKCSRRIDSASELSEQESKKPGRTSKNPKGHLIRESASKRRKKLVHKKKTEDSGLDSGYEEPRAEQKSVNSENISTNIPKKGNKLSKANVAHLQTFDKKSESDTVNAHEHKKSTSTVDMPMKLDETELEYTPSDKGKKRKRVNHGNSKESHPPEKIKKAKQTRLTFSDAHKSGVKQRSVAKDRRETIAGTGVNKCDKGNGQQRVDVLMKKISQGEKESGGLSISDSTFRSRSSFNSDLEYREYIEERDRLYALKLQEEFKLEHKHNLTVLRVKGSEGEYSLRRKTSSVKYPE